MVQPISAGNETPHDIGNYFQMFPYFSLENYSLKYD